MDFFILFNDNMSPPTNDKPLALEQEMCTNEESVAHTQETIETTDATST